MTLERSVTWCGNIPHYSHQLDVSNVKYCWGTLFHYARSWNHEIYWNTENIAECL